MKEKIVYIVNPVAGKLSKREKIRVIDSIYPGSEPETIFSTSEGDAGEKAQEFISKKYLVVACGGDGFINIIAQKPKISKYKKRLLMNISKLCEISNKRINIKAKTTEKLGVIGKEKAIAVEVILSVIKYDE